MQSDYYTRKYIGYLILEQAKDREVAMLPAFRAGQTRNLEELQSLLDLVSWKKRKINMYISCAKLEKIPNFTFNLKTRAKDFTHEWFQSQFDNLVYEADLFIDIDADLFENSYNDAKKLKEFLDMYELPYQLIFSGNKGFHFVIDGEYMPLKKENGMAHPHTELCEILKSALSLKYIDLSNNHLLNRLRKLPYSLVLPNEFKNSPELVSEDLLRVALPLTDDEFKTFNIRKSMLRNVLKDVKLMRRGKVERHQEMPLEKKKEKINKFIKEVVF